MSGSSTPKQPVPTLRRRLIGLLPTRFRALLRHLRSGSLLSPHARASFSQEGEDLLLARIFETEAAGFYVDVGAHHPTRFSNTHLLYLKGWRGINIDPTPGSMAPFQRIRPDDINLELAVASGGGTHRLHLFNDPALNTLSGEVSARRDRQSRYTIEATVDVPTRPLYEILAEFLPRHIQRIDLMTIDVEGQDLDVLRSNDWNRFRPCVLLVEMLETDVGDLDSREETIYLRKHGYRLYAKLMNTVVFIDSDSGALQSR